ncbi:hypothetical protein BGZ94_004804 [Podila epigama]|nr:hypothetical protein BGZ94_004804 [Podila epigama]
MKTILFAAIALLSMTMAAPASEAPAPIDTAAAPTTASYEFDGNSKCQIAGFKISFSKVTECCLKNMGGSEFDGKKRVVNCVLPIGREGRMRKCVKDLGYATAVDCYYKSKDE